ncbi:putative integrator complex subunit 8 [Plasmopara halstedii]
MPLMPGSPCPRPGTPTPQNEDDGVYRSLFQQPVMDIPPTAPSYAWFEFLLHPEALQKHQKYHDTHCATSAIELVREFLDQAQLVADEGNVRNKRYSALLLVAAQVVMQMQLSLSDIEEALPLHYQRLLLDGIVDLAEQPSSSHSTFKTETIIKSYEAHLLHKRWTLRTLINQSLNGFLTCSTRSEGEEISATFQMALGDLMASHLQIAQSIESILLSEEKQALSVKTQLETWYDLGRYFFSFTGFEKAYSCFSRASELGRNNENDDQDIGVRDSAKLFSDIQSNLEGYLSACAAVLEVQSVNESPAVLKTPKIQIGIAWESQDWDKVIEILENDLVASEPMKLPQGFRAALEQQALKLLRSNSNETMQTGLQIVSHTTRYLYERIVLENAVTGLLFENGEDEVTTVENCICIGIRLLQDDSFYSIVQGASTDEVAKNCLTALALFVLQLSEFATLKASDDRAKKRIKQFVSQVVRHLPCIKDLTGNSAYSGHFGNLDGMESLVSLSSAESLDGHVRLERHHVTAAAKQKKHFRLMADMGSIFVFPSAYERDSFAVTLQKELVELAKSVDGAQADDIISRNLITFCTANNCWDILSQWSNANVVSKQMRCDLNFVVACGALVQYLSSLMASHLSANGTTGSVALFVSSLKENAAFSISASNKFMAEILLKWRELTNTVSTGLSKVPDTEQQNHDRFMVLMGLPLWVVEILVCISAGLLHRAYMCNTCDYRVSFDLNPYGELAYLAAFAPDVSLMPLEASAASTGSSDEQFATVPFVKHFQVDLVELHSKALQTLVSRCGREPRWHCAKADLLLNPLTKQRLASTSDPRAALESYLVAALLATNFFSDMISVVDVIDQSSLVRLSQCLVKIGAHVAAAVLYQCFAPEEFKYGLRILRLAPECHDEGFYQYFWQLPFLELLVDLHSRFNHPNDRHVTLLTNLIQSPELNSSNPTPVVKDAEQRILRCYFRDLCRLYLCE